MSTPRSTLDRKRELAIALLQSMHTHLRPIKALELVWIGTYAGLTLPVVAWLVLRSVAGDDLPRLLLAIIAVAYTAVAWWFREIMLRERLSYYRVLRNVIRLQHWLGAYRWKLLSDKWRDAAYPLGEGPLPHKDGTQQAASFSDRLWYIDAVLYALMAAIVWHTRAWLCEHQQGWAGLVLLGGAAIGALIHTGAQLALSHVTHAPRIRKARQRVSLALAQAADLLAPTKGAGRTRRLGSSFCRTPEGRDPGSRWHLACHAAIAAWIAVLAPYPEPIHPVALYLLCGFLVGFTLWHHFLWLLPYDRFKLRKAAREDWREGLVGSSPIPCRRPDAHCAG